MDDVLYSVDDAVATVTLNRPEAMNSLTAQAKAGLLEALTTASQALRRTGGAADRIGAGVLRRPGPERARGQPGGGPRPERHRTRALQPDRPHDHQMGKPVVAAVNGVAAGAGAALAFACDLRVASEKAKFAMAFACIGLAPDSGASWTLQRLVGLARASELLLLGEPLDAARALELGVVSRVVPADELGAAAHELAVRLARGPTRRLRGDQAGPGPTPRAAPWPTPWPWRPTSRTPAPRPTTT